MSTASQIRFFEPEAAYGWLCVLSPHPVMAGGRRWLTAEHYYQALKFESSPAIQAEIASAPTALEAKAIARHNKAIRPADWKSALALPAFYCACKLKFDQHPDLAALLLATGDAQLVEANSDDPFWGCGPDGHGQNWVGRILMEIRAGMAGAGAGADA